MVASSCRLGQSVDRVRQDLPGLPQRLHRLAQEWQQQDVCRALSCSLLGSFLPSILADEDLRAMEKVVALSSHICPSFSVTRHLRLTDRYAFDWTEHA
jgi:hypothetical protein